ncbi:putative LIM domain-containing serine/threonine-protein kinase [Tetrabaena socialis]|uniref:Putative LIM domain-containing serine/threonine-protein kinase n=1 Tax=Tetrabaena socialis TaxID=47790 RepID=A0A2J8AEI3_9CHLO|nr:putative LIM domain-containing serine/threonine-protein kinase [Tetrabaena socialis]|eukprot:PNH10931.1 putative LIM domain-containing serine/threonine-protein kinase [Tetrabaena socialis]
MLEAVTGGRRPFGSVPSERITSLVASGARPALPAGVPQPYRDLAQACWAHSPRHRPSAAQLVTALRQQLGGCDAQQPPQTGPRQQQG